LQGRKEDKYVQVKTGTKTKIKEQQYKNVKERKRNADNMKTATKNLTY
jgi:hypothetical protein